MLSRRNLINGGLVAGLAGTALPHREAGAAARNQDDGSASALRPVLEDIRTMLRNQYSCAPTTCGEADLLRQEQRRFLKASGKFPDYIDVGLDVWERMYDWHVRNLQNLAISRTAEGRYSMVYALTTLVLRHDMSGNYIGLGYDNK
jgi:hypothetical protein